MVKLLAKNGRFVIRNGRFVAVDDPAECDCCGPTQIPCQQVQRITVEWGGIKLSRVPSLPNGFECGGAFDHCNVGGEGQFPQSVSVDLCTPHPPPDNWSWIARISTVSWGGEHAPFPRCTSFANTPDRVIGEFHVEIYSIEGWWRRAYSVDSLVKDGAVEPGLIIDMPAFDPSAFGAECAAAMQPYWNQPPKVTIELVQARKPSTNPFP